VIVDPPGKDKIVVLGETVKICRALGGRDGFDLFVATDHDTVKVVELEHDAAKRFVFWFIRWWVTSCWFGVRTWLWERARAREVDRLLRQQARRPEAQPTVVTPARVTSLWRSRKLAR
jgi:hypothetical protein